MHSVHMNPLRAIWYVIWYKPAAQWALGQITFTQMLMKYIFLIYFLFIFPLTVYGIYVYEATPDHVWRRPPPQPSLEEVRRQQEPGIFPSKVKDPYLCGPGPYGKYIHQELCGDE